MKIGYQGIEGSYSYQATIEFIKNMNFEKVEMIPLITSIEVVKKLKNKEIDYGVMAIENSTAGTVKETQIAIKNENLKLIKKQTILIEHCLYKKKECEISKLDKVVSHEQALLQTQKTRREKFNKLEQVEFSDTALAAKELSENVFDDKTAVICSELAGKIYDLDLVYKKLNDLVRF